MSEKEMSLGYKDTCNFCGQRRWIHGVAWDWPACRDCWNELQEDAIPDRVKRRLRRRRPVGVR